MQARSTISNASIMTNTVSNYANNRWLMRLQLGGALVFAAILPYFVRAFTVDGRIGDDASNLTFLGILISICLGTWLFRNIGSFPGVESSAYAFPALSIVFATLLLVFVLGRLPYDRVLLATGYIFTLIWFYGVQLSLPSKTTTIGVLPGVDIGLIGKNIEIVGLFQPSDIIPDVDIVAADLRSDMTDEWESCLARYALVGLPVYHFKHLRESLTGRIELEHLSENNFGSLSPVSAFMQLKHVFDWILAVLIGILLVPVFVIVAALIRLGSPGPALFRQTRIGYRGEPFTVYKFRTMRHDVSKDDARSAAITKSADNRITPLGRFLRKSRLDELPQILNIIRGEMSWIGPRPEADVLSNWYRQEIPYYAYRHIVRPGITGWAQVCQGHVASVDEVKEKLHYDFYYIKNFSLWLDILIIARTVQTMITGFGSK